MGKMVRASFTLPPELVSDLDRLSSVMGVSKSALLSGVLRDPVADLLSVLERSGVFDGAPISEVKARMRGESAEVIRMRLAELDALADGDLVTPAGRRDEAHS